MASPRSRTFAGLLASNVLGGVGLAAGVATAGLLVQQLASTEWAGFGSALGVLGAAVASVPLAQLAARRGRRISIATGYAIAVIGALITIAGAVTENLWITLIGLFVVGSTHATTLQTRYAAADLESGQVRARAMSYVIWAITIGSVLGPNLLGPGAGLGQALGLPELAGPYVITIVAVLGAIVVVLWLVHPPSSLADLAEGQVRVGAKEAPPSGKEGGKRTSTAISALRWAHGHPMARFAVVAIAVAHAVMVGLMSMTSVHLRDQGADLATIGLVISLHILGMWGLSPVFGWACERFGPNLVTFGGLTILLTAIVLAIIGGFSTTIPVITAALFLLGLGWSAVLVSSSALLASVDSGAVRVPLQGATDALMHYAAAGAALLGGPVLSWFGYSGLAGLAGAFLLPAAVVGVLAWGGRTEGFTAQNRRR
ncbi:MAG: MFS transporter [bacterium]|nr:MFS transporter [bacterium]